LLLPAGHYVVVKRFSAKEERRRVVAALLSPEDVDGSDVAVENHLNVIHSSRNGLDRDLAVGLVYWMNSSWFDGAFRQFSGHTQVNATDLRSMAFPSEERLRAIGRTAINPPTAQEWIDRMTAQHLPPTNVNEPTKSAARASAR